jgi:hypothetical protein
VMIRVPMAVEPMLMRVTRIPGYLALKASATVSYLDGARHCQTASRLGCLIQLVQLVL